jgi:hypothetical protein
MSRNPNGHFPRFSSIFRDLLELDDGKQRFSVSRQASP